MTLLQDKLRIRECSEKRGKININWHE